MSTAMRVSPSANMRDVSYEIRGPLLDLAKRYERDGVDVLKLNIGDPPAFGVRPPAAVLDAVEKAIRDSTCYTDGTGPPGARAAIALDCERRGVSMVDIDDVFVGNGVSELVTLSLAALLEPGDEVLIPAPDYPLWTASVAALGGRPVHYLCDERDGWAPDLADLEAKVGPRTRAIVVINPNNPTGAVWPRPVLERIANIAAVHGVLLMADEVYDRIVYDGVVHTPMAAIAPDLPCVTFSGLSKRARVPGLRAGWMVLTGPRTSFGDYGRAVETLALMRLCPNHPAQRAIEVSLDEGDGIAELVGTGGRLAEQSDLCHRLLTDIPGVSCVKPDGAFYVFPKLDPRRHPVENDADFALELLRQQKMLIVQGSGLGWPRHDHFRMVTLPPPDQLTDAVGRLADFLDHRNPA